MSGLIWENKYKADIETTNFHNLFMDQLGKCKQIFRWNPNSCIVCVGDGSSTGFTLSLLLPVPFTLRTVAKDTNKLTTKQFLWT